MPEASSSLRSTGVEKTLGGVSLRLLTPHACTLAAVSLHRAALSLESTLYYGSTVFSLDWRT
jgi:hypothetical protein